MPDSSQEKTEQPTPKRLREARRKGQVFKSKDLEAVAVFIGVFAGIAMTHSYMSSELRSFMEEAFRMVGKPDLAGSDIYAIGKMAFIAMIKVSFPIVGIAMLLAGIVGYLQVGSVFSIEPLKPQMKKLNAIENLKNMFKPKMLIELVKNLIKLAVIFFIAYSVLKGMLEPFLLTVSAPIEGTAKLGSMILVKFFVRFLIVFLLVACMDLFLQRKEYIKNLKMTKEEVKREYKEDEGDPMIKGARRQLHMEMAMGGGTPNKVKNADAVVTNPTHIAVAIKYDKNEMVAPQVVAKGQRLYAEYIKDLAKEFDVPIIRNVPLAWSLLELEIDDEVPEKLYIAVAEILTFVYKLKEERDRVRATPRDDARRSQPQAPQVPKSAPRSFN
ncbi:MAG TPA: type III secretion system export apparatus subunit SctU [bacterium]|nr:type III secretion system export apparatus subunit SctU [bacterium]